MAREDTSEEGQRRRRKRRRRRGGRREDGATAGTAPMPPDAEQPELEDIEFPGAVRVAPAAITAPDSASLPDPAESLSAGPGGLPAPVPGHDEAAEAAEEQGKPRRPQRRRGGKRPARAPIAATRHPAPAPYAGPTPADPFSNVADIFDMLEQAEQQRAAPPAPHIPAAVNGLQQPAELALDAEVAPVVATSEPAPNPGRAAETISQEPIVGPAIKPVVIGEGESTAERKRGWWRR